MCACVCVCVLCVCESPRSRSHAGSRRATAVYFTVTSSVKVAAKYPNCCLFCLSPSLASASVRPAVPPPAPVPLPFAPSSALLVFLSTAATAILLIVSRSYLSTTSEPTNAIAERGRPARGRGRGRSSMFCSFVRSFENKREQRSFDDILVHCRYSRAVAVAIAAPEFVPKIRAMHGICSTR